MAKRKCAKRVTRPGPASMHVVCDDNLVGVFSYLDAHSLARAATTCTRLNDIAARTPFDWSPTAPINRHFSPHSYGRFVGPRGHRRWVGRHAFMRNTMALAARGAIHDLFFTTHEYCQLGFLDTVFEHGKPACVRWQGPTVHRELRTPFSTNHDLLQDKAYVCLHSAGGDRWHMRAELTAGRVIVHYLVKPLTRDVRHRIATKYSKARMCRIHARANRVGPPDSQWAFWVEPQSVLLERQARQRADPEDGELDASC